MGTNIYTLSTQQGRNFNKSFRKELPTSITKVRKIWVFKLSPTY